MPTERDLSGASQYDELRVLATKMRAKYTFGPDDFQYLNRLADGVLMLLDEREAKAASSK